MLYGKINTLKFKILLSFTIVVSVVTLSLALVVRDHIDQTVDKSHEENSRNVLNSLYLLLETQYKSIQFHKDATFEDKKRSLKDRAEMAYAYAEYFHSQAVNGKMSMKAAKRRAKRVIKSIRYDKGVGYIWINGVERPYPKMIMHPTIPSLDGKILDDKKFNSALGNDKNLFQAFVDVVLWQDEGFVDYMWPKPMKTGLSEDKAKVSFVKIFKPWKWVLGTGLYVDDIEEEARKKFEVILQELRSVMSKVKIGKSGYVFIFDKSFRLQVHPSLQGTDLSEVINPQTGSPLLADLAEASATPNVPFRYKWDKPFSADGKFIFWKKAHVRHFAPLDWYISSSYYEDEAKDITDDVNFNIMVISLCILFASLVGGFFISEQLVRPIKALKDLVKNFNMEEAEVDSIPVHGTEETRELGASFRQMVQSTQDSRQALVERESVLNAIYNESVQLMGVVSPEGTLLSANKTSLDFIKVNEDVVKGTPFIDTPWWRNSTKSQNLLSQAIEEAKNGRQVRIEAEIANYNDDRVFLDFSMTPILGPNGEVTSMVAEGRDITEKRLSDLERAKNLLFFKALESVSSSVRGITDISKFLNALTHSLLDVFECDRVLVTSHTDGFSVISKNTVAQYDIEHAYEDDSSKSQVLSDLYKQCSTNSDVIVYTFDGSDDDWRSQSSVRFKSCLMMSFLFDKDISWTLEIHQCDHSRSWEEYELKLVKEIMAKTSVAISSMRSQQSLAESDRLIHDIIDNSNSIISLKSIDGKYINVNKEFERVFSVDQDDVLGKTDEVIFAPDRSAKYRESEVEVISKKESLQIEENIYTSDGEKYFLSTKFPLFDVSESVYAVCTISTDITERRAIEKTLENLVESRTKDIVSKNKDLRDTIQDLKKTQGQLVAQEKLASLGTIASGIAHEIKNPLNFIINSGKIVSRVVDSLNDTIANEHEKLGEELSNKLKSTVKQLEGAAKLVTKHGVRSDEIVKSMIDFTSAEDSDLTVVDIKEVVERAIRLSFGTARTRFNISVTPSLSIENVEKVCLHPPEFERGVIHVLDNAFHAVFDRYNKEGESYNPAIDVSLKLDGNLLLIIVSDNGVGVPEEIADKIFDPFITNRLAGEGAGLGLAMAFDIFSKHHGAISYSKGEEQTVFKISIPMDLDNRKES